MGDDQLVQVIQGWLCVSVDMYHYPAEDLGIVQRLRTYFRVKILKLDLLAPEVFWKAPELGSSIFVSFFVVEGVCFDVSR